MRMARPFKHRLRTCSLHLAVHIRRGCPGRSPAFPLSSGVSSGVDAHPVDEETALGEGAGPPAPNALHRQHASP
jgi:hypothetical protein